MLLQDAHVILQHHCMPTYIRSALFGHCQLSSDISSTTCAVLCCVHAAQLGLGDSGKNHQKTWTLNRNRMVSFWILLNLIFPFSKFHHIPIQISVSVGGVGGWWGWCGVWGGLGLGGSSCFTTQGSCICFGTLFVEQVYIGSRCLPKHSVELILILNLTCCGVWGYWRCWGRAQILSNNVELIWILNLTCCGVWGYWGVG